MSDLEQWKRVVAAHEQRHSGMIHEIHIDIFTGSVTAERNPFPRLIKSKPPGTFDAFLIDDANLTASLKTMHITP